jgi:beta-hydroxylase
MDLELPSLRRIKSLPTPVRRPLLKFGLSLIAPFNRLVRRTRLGNVEFYPREELPWIGEVEANWQKVQAELDAVLSRLREVPNAQDAYSGQEALTTDDKWKTFVFCRGARVWEQANCKACPETRKVLERIPGLEHAMFSILAPGKKLPAHVGPYAGLLDCHMGLRVPADTKNCQLRVGATVVSWQEGRMIVFDDSLEHEVWNNTDSIRAVLLLYVVRPLPMPLSAVNMALMRFLERVL